MKPNGTNGRLRPHLAHGDRNVRESTARRLILNETVEVVQDGPIRLRYFRRGDHAYLLKQWCGDVQFQKMKGSKA